MVISLIILGEQNLTCKVFIRKLYLFLLVQNRADIIDFYSNTLLIFLILCSNLLRKPSQNHLHTIDGKILFALVDVIVQSKTY